MRHPQPHISAPALMVAALVLCAASTPATQSAASGRWEGEIKTPGQGIRIILELVAGARWQGITTFPDQSDVELRLLNLKVEGAEVSFDMPAAPGYPSFRGKISDDGESISGEFSQSGQTLPTALKRKGAPRFKPAPPPAPNPLLDALSGDWEGTLEIGDQSLRLKLKLAPNAGDDIPGFLDSIDQQTLIPVNTLMAENDSFRIDLDLIQGSFSGKLSPDRSSWQGKWEQPGISRPLAFKRLSVPKKP